MNAATILEVILQVLPYAAGIVAWIFKDRILHFLNVELKRTSVKTAKKEIDSIHIDNSSKLIEIYSKSMDDLTERHDKTIENIRRQYELDLAEMKDEYEKERKKDKEENRLYVSELDRLKQQVKQLTEEVRKLTAQLRYYRENTSIELPEDLR